MYNFFINEYMNMEQFVPLVALSNNKLHSVFQITDKAAAIVRQYIWFINAWINYNNILLNMLSCAMFEVEFFLNLLYCLNYPLDIFRNDQF